ncbi:hypothetical protein [Bacillus sp. FSL M7-0417]|uniref:hypothetical protein n=1 Tax=Bacillus sp. FSL M7-0417 TaxID=2921532 RepID=UPI002E23FD94|nr:hypothetical protein [Bacillus subtilis]
MKSTKNNYYYCYSENVFKFLKDRSHYAIFVGFTNNGSKIAIFEQSDRLSQDLKEYTKQKFEGWNR